jgi:hypothetical protein
MGDRDSPFPEHGEARSRATTNCKHVDNGRCTVSHNIFVFVFLYTCKIHFLRFFFSRSEITRGSIIDRRSPFTISPTTTLNCETVRPAVHTTYTIRRTWYSQNGTNKTGCFFISPGQLTDRHYPCHSAFPCFSWALALLATSDVEAPLS